MKNISVLVLCYFNVFQAVRLFFERKETCIKLASIFCIHINTRGRVSKQVTDGSKTAGMDVIVFYVYH
jgi:hypothetical protein